MKFVEIQPVPKPKSFDDVRFTKVDWDAIVKAGAKTVPFVTAMEAIKNSKGAYRLAPEAKNEVSIKALKEPDEMTNVELFQEMTLHGKPPRKKMNRTQAVKFVQELRERSSAMIVDDDDEDSE